MARKLRVVGTAAKVIRDTSVPRPLVSRSLVAATLGAEATDTGTTGNPTPPKLLALRSELVARLRSSGGRPAPVRSSRRTMISLDEEDWANLEELTAAVADTEFKPSTWQVASVLLALSVKSAISQLEPLPEVTSLPLAREIAARFQKVSPQV